MESLKKAFEFFKGMFLNLNGFLGNLITDYGTATYVVLFMIIFVETGVVIMPFLPGIAFFLSQVHLLLAEIQA